MAQETFVVPPASEDESSDECNLPFTFDSRVRASEVIISGQNGATIRAAGSSRRRLTVAGGAVYCHVFSESIVVADACPCRATLPFQIL